MPPREPIFLTMEEVLSLHFESLERYGGLRGIRDEAMLESALAQPQAGFSGKYLHQTLFDMAAAYLYHITNNHPFLDGNKRTAFACAVVFLKINGLCLHASQAEAYELVMDTTTGTREKADIAEFLRLRCLPST